MRSRRGSSPCWPLLTLIWGLNWPIMKIGVTGFPPLTFRTLSMWLGLPVLLGGARCCSVPLADRRARTGASSLC